LTQQEIHTERERERERERDSGQEEQTIETIETDR